MIDVHDCGLAGCGNVATGASDPELAELAKEDIARIEARQTEILGDIERILDKEKEEESKPKAVILEFRAAAGGDEAMIFAKDLKHMYERFAEARGWRVRLIDDLTIEIAGGDAYDALRYEMGVHRVQRVPVTEKSGRIHTSTSSVAVLPIRVKPKVEINPADIEMEFTRSGGAGGQNVNKVESKIRVTHLPTGLQTTCQDERDQSKNLAKALAELERRLLVKERVEKARALNEERNRQQGSGRVRTYNLARNEVVDHRTGKRTTDVAGVLDGKLELVRD